jgi:Zn finger protein HypA/HybF involved in hydrogenase expression
MKYKYLCNHCKSLFEELEDFKKIESSLIRYSLLICPYCKSENIGLTDQAKLIIDRSEKIKKIKKISE